MLKIISAQVTDDGKDGQELIVKGNVSYLQDEVIIEYTEETEEIGSEHTKITFRNGNEISIVREGQFSSEMIVEKGKRHTTFYKTPYGEFTMGIYGREVSFLRNEKQSVLRMKYTLDFNNGFVSLNSMNIYIEE